MGLSINNNIAAANAYRNLSGTQNDLSKSLEKLSSGFRINRAADDAAGLAISEGLRSQVGGLKVAARNAQDGISVVQTAEGALTEVHSILQRLRDLGVQAANDSNDAKSRANIQTEATSLVQELDRISTSTNFNGTKLLDGSAAELAFQVGADGNAASQIKVNLAGANIKGVAVTLAGGDLGLTGTSFAIADHTVLDTAAATFTATNGTTTTAITTGVLDDTADGSGAGFQSVDEYAAALRSDAGFSSNFSVAVERDTNGAGVGIIVTALNGGTVDVTAPGTAGVAAGSAGTALTGGIAFDSAINAQASISMIEAQIQTVSTARAELGAYQNRFEHSIKSISVSIENLSASESRIRDTDMALEMVNFTRAQILSQAGTAMLAQANQIPQGVLQLLR